ncbi:MAG: SDR family NAD(P)-dependent oxidoreductase [Alistipes sp.]|nr:SDR family NAD(P)-dependent oxidoreductase [Alistipes sp.]
MYALVTGGSSGMGEVFARELAKAGYNLLIVSNRDADNRRVAEQIASLYGVDAIPIYSDLTADDAAERLYAEVQSRGLQVEVLISNAGMLIFSQMCRTSIEALDKIIALHCTTPTKLCRLFAEQMAERGKGYILLVSSITAWTPFPTVSHYASTKAYLKSLGEALWYEYRERGVGITTLLPSAVDTPLYNLDNKTRRRLLLCGVMMSAESVVQKALKAMFRRQARCLPGLLTKVEALLCAIMPRWALLPILKIPAVKSILRKV